MKPDLPFGGDQQHVYVMRVWFERDGPRRVWRASLRIDHATCRHFASPGALLAFLNLAIVPPTSSPEST